MQILAEARIRLVSGLKKYFHGKRAEGLLSARGMQLLDFMCDLQMDHAEEPLFMWSLTEKQAPSLSLYLVPSSSRVVFGADEPSNCVM